MTNALSAAPLFAGATGVQTSRDNESKSSQDIERRVDWQGGIIPLAREAEGKTSQTVEGLIGKVTQLEGENTTLRIAVEKQAATILSMRKEHDELEAKNRGLETQVESLTEAVAQIENKRATEQDLKDRALAEAQESERQAKAYENHAKTYENQAKEAERAVSRLSLQNAQLASETKESQGVVEAMTMELHKAHQMMADLQAGAKEITDSTKPLRDLLQVTQQTLATTTKVLETTTRALEREQARARSNEICSIL